MPPDRGQSACPVHGLVDSRQSATTALVDVDAVVSKTSTSPPGVSGDGRPIRTRFAAAEKTQASPRSVLVQAGTCQRRGPAMHAVPATLTRADRHAATIVIRRILNCHAWRTDQSLQSWHCVSSDQAA